MIGRRTERQLLAAFSLACAASCSSGTAQTDGGATTGYTKIDDMEGDGRSSIEWTAPSDLMPGFWYTSTGCGAEGSILPTPGLVVDGAFVPGAWSFAALPATYET